MMKQSIRVLAEASRKSSENRGLRLETILPVLDVITGLKAEIEAVSAEVGMTIMQRYLEQEIRERSGAWGQKTHYRHGEQPGYVVFHGRKVPIQKPRMREKGGREVALETPKGRLSRLSPRPPGGCRERRWDT